MRADGRKFDELRKLKIMPSFMANAEGSCLIEMGNTKVICTASVENKVPDFLKDSQSGWITAEYAMLPRSCGSRVKRDIERGKINGRSQEIQRLIGRSVRAVADLSAICGYTILLDCDVLQGDGGTRTASITGAFISFAQACAWMKEKGLISKCPYTDMVSAISVGIVGGEELLDLNYGEDSRADVDMNVVMTASGRIIEVQATAERVPFTRTCLGKLLDLASGGIDSIFLDVKKIIPETI